MGHTVSMGFFYDPTCTNKIVHRFQPADVSGTVSMASLSEGQQTHPAATKTRKHIIYGFSDLPENKKKQSSFKDDSFKFKRQIHE